MPDSRLANLGRRRAGGVTHWSGLAAVGWLTATGTLLVLVALSLVSRVTAVSAAGPEPLTLRGQADVKYQGNVPQLHLVADGSGAAAAHLDAVLARVPGDDQGSASGVQRSIHLQGTFVL